MPPRLRLAPKLNSRRPATSEHLPGRLFNGVRLHAVIQAGTGSNPTRTFLQPSRPTPPCCPRCSASGTTDGVDRKGTYHYVERYLSGNTASNLPTLLLGMSSFRIWHRLPQSVLPRFQGCVHGAGVSQSTSAAVTHLAARSTQIVQRQTFKQ